MIKVFGGELWKELVITSHSSKRHCVGSEFNINIFNLTKIEHNKRHKFINNVNDKSLHSTHARENHSSVYILPFV